MVHDVGNMPINPQNPWEFTTGFNIGLRELTGAIITLIIASTTQEPADIQKFINTVQNVTNMNEAPANLQEINIDRLNPTWNSIESSLESGTPMQKIGACSQLLNTIFSSYNAASIKSSYPEFEVASANIANLVSSGSTNQGQALQYLAQMLSTVLQIGAQTTPNGNSIMASANELIPQIATNPSAFTTFIQETANIWNL